MSSAPVDFWQFALSISTSLDEAAQRASISRAYYAAYHSCLAWHAKLPIPGSNTGPGGGFHQELINQLRNPDASNSPQIKALSRSLGYTLQDIKGHRFLADYGLPDPVDPTMPADTCSKAKQILDKAV
jgi:hypothetical protein